MHFVKYFAFFAEASSVYKFITFIYEFIHLYIFLYLCKIVIFKK